jgi:dihydropteroate synthase
MFDDVPDDVRDGLARAAQASGLACLTGTGWVLLAGDAARLAGLSRPEPSVLPAPLDGELAAILRGVVEPPAVWETCRGTVTLDRPRVVGILNVTPDSFSDGGRFFEPEAARRHAENLLAQGADALDVGAESTRPGRPDSVPAAEEWRRLAPVLGALAARFPTTPLSVDTRKAEVAAPALEAGAWIVNDVSGLRHDPRLADVCAAAGAGLVLMHSRGTVSDMATYEHATYDDVAEDVRAELETAVRESEARGVPAARIVVDPGFGFAKRPEHNFRLLDRLAVLGALGRPMLVGPSRKRFLGLDGRPPAERDVATAAACVAAYERGARLFRVHNVAMTREALDVAHAIREAGGHTGSGTPDRRTAGPPDRRPVGQGGAD